MIYPIVAYGDPVLKKMGAEVQMPKEELIKFIDDMFETMYNANGVGLAAPQIGESLRLFVVDATPMMEDEEGETEIDFKKVFINPIIEEEWGDEWSYEEGCLSIPSVRGEVFRPESLRITYEDIDGNKITEEHEGIAARVIQHEYDHIEGVLFTEHLSGLKKRMLKSKLAKISKGNIQVGYRMKFPS